MPILALELRARHQAWHQTYNKIRRWGLYLSGFHLCYQAVFCSNHGTIEMVQIRTALFIWIIICGLPKPLCTLSEGESTF